MKLIQTNDYLLLIDEEAEIKEGDLFWYRNYKVLLCTGINNRFILTDNKKPKHSHYGKPPQLCKKITAYLPLTSEAKELNLPLLPSFENKIDVVALAIEKYGDNYSAINQIDAFKQGYKAAQSKQFSLEDMQAFGKKCFYKGFDKSENDDVNCFTAWKEEANELLQSLSTQQLPKEFIPEFQYFMLISSTEEQWLMVTKESYEKTKKNFGATMVKKYLKTITNSEGKQELVGTYK